MNAIERLIRPRSVAIIGASADPEKTSGRPVSILLKHGFAGEIYPVNPKAGRIGELVCYPDIASLPAVPDVGIVLLGAEWGISRCANCRNGAPLPRSSSPAASLKPATRVRCVRSSLWKPPARCGYSDRTPSVWSI